MEGASIVAEKLRSTVQDRKFFCEDKGITLNLTISIGVTTHYGDADLSLDRIIGQADGALYDAKKGGRNRVVVYRQQLL
jgi:diguanylate cyclase (GGDEF)-like protein